jgi:hypothetical protein
MSGWTVVGYPEATAWNPRRLRHHMLKSTSRKQLKFALMGAPQGDPTPHD